MYTALGTRADISYAVSFLSHFNTNPRTRHLTAAKRVLRYLKRTKHQRLLYTTGGDLHGYVDADWANGKDRKSVGGYAFLFGGAAISWNSKKQSLVAQSTEEAEYTAFTEGSRDALWIRQLLQEINSMTADCDSTQETATKIFADNQAAIKHAHSEGITARTKHFEIRLQHSRDLQKKGIINFTYIKSDDNIADALTKGLPRPAHERHAKGFGLK